MLTKWLNRPAKPAPDPTAEELVRNGNAQLGKGRFDAAAECYERAIAADPKLVGPHVNLGFVHLEQGRPKEALPPLRAAIALDDRSHDAHYLLGTALADEGAFRDAAVHLEAAIRLKSDLLEAYGKLALSYFFDGRHDDAESVLRRGLALDPGLPDLHFYLGNVLAGRMRPTEAVASYERALAIDSRNAAIYSNLAPAVLQLGDHQRAAACARQALALDPAMQQARSNLLMALASDPSCSPAAYLAEARLYGAQVLTASTHRARARRPQAGSEPPRRLRVGFVSGDLRSHPVGYFLEGSLAHWDAEQMDAVAYSNHRGEDELTRRLRSHFVAWRDISGLGDDAAQSLIEEDRIDVLVDLSGHTPANRLPLFARRAAPVQVAWLGYWASTGVPSMDYLLADRTSLPESEQCWYTEQVRYLPDTRLCFTPPAGPAVPAVAELPALRSGFITFGSFQRLTKLDDAVLHLWARVMREVPDTRLRLQSAQMADVAAREQLLQRLEVAGIAARQVELVGPMARSDYLAAHAEVDIILDTFPHNGATTTCEALWMGVPTLTLAGSTLLSRQGASLMTSAGLRDWIASSEDDFVARAKRHASDVHPLARMRLSLRDTVARTPLFDSRRFATALQVTFTRMVEEK